MSETSKGNILLVDDDKFLLDMYAMKFHGQGYAVASCLSVGEALEALKRGFTADVILFDLTMPERDGFSFLQSLRDDHLGEHAIKIALSNQTDDAEKAKAAELGAGRYIVKASMIPSEVVAVVAEELAKRKTA